MEKQLHETPRDRLINDTKNEEEEWPEANIPLKDEILDSPNHSRRLN